MSDLQHIQVAIIALDGFEEVELTEPRKALEKAGAKVEVISAKPGEIQGFQHHDKAGKVRVDRTLDDASPNRYDAVVLPGGAFNADDARANPKVRQFIREMDRAEKPMAVICHAPWELISAEAGPRPQINQLADHSGRRPQRRRRMAGPGSGGRSKLGDQPRTARFARIQPRDDRAVFTHSRGVAPLAVRPHGNRSLTLVASSWELRP